MKMMYSEMQQQSNCQRKKFSGHQSVGTFILGLNTHSATYTVCFIVANFPCHLPVVINFLYFWKRQFKPHLLWSKLSLIKE